MPRLNQVRHLSSSCDMTLQDKHEGKLAELWAAQLAGSGLPILDVAAGLSHVFAAKEPEEVRHLQPILPFEFVLQRKWL